MTGEPEQDAPSIELTSGLMRARCSPIQERWYRIRDALSAARSTAPFVLVDDLLLTGPLDVPALADSVLATVRRQWALRTAFSVDGDQVTQHVIEPSPEHVFEVHDLRSVTARPAAVDEWLEHLYTRGHDLSAGKVFHAGLISFDDHHHRLVLAADHIVRDARSGDILFRDILSIYRKLRADPRVDPDRAISPLRHQYVDWSDYQWRLLDGGYRASLREFWTTRLSGAPDLRLPADRPASCDISLGHLVADAISADALATLDALVPSVAATEATRRTRLLAKLAARPIACLSLMFAWLHRITGQEDLCVAMPTDARSGEFASVVGHFAIPTIIRVQVGCGMRFRELVARVSGSFLEAQQWRRAPLYAAWQPPRGLWTVAFNYRRQGRRARALGLEVRPSPERYPVDFNTDMDLIWMLVESELTGRLHIGLTGRDCQFAPETLRQFVRQFIDLAVALLADPDRRVSDC